MRKILCEKKTGALITHPGKHLQKYPEVLRNIRLSNMSSCDSDEQLNEVVKANISGPYVTSPNGEWAEIEPPNINGMQIIQPIFLNKPSISSECYNQMSLAIDQSKRCKCRKERLKRKLENAKDGAGIPRPDGFKNYDQIHFEKMIQNNKNKQRNAPMYIPRETPNTSICSSIKGTHRMKKIKSILKKDVGEKTNGRIRFNDKCEIRTISNASTSSVSSTSSKSSLPPRPKMPDDRLGVKKLFNPSGSKNSLSTGPKLPREDLSELDSGYCLRKFLNS